MPPGGELSRQAPFGFLPADEEPPQPSGHSTSSSRLPVPNDVLHRAQVNKPPPVEACGPECSHIGHSALR